MNKDIKLRNLEETDLEMVRNWRNSKEVSQYMYTENHISKEDQIKWFHRIKSDTSCKYWIIEFENKPLGLASITDINSVYDSCFWAFYLGDSSVRGAGIGAKVEYNILSFVFDELKLNKLRCEVFTFNDKVITMHEKFGFRRESYYREHIKKGDKYYDVVGLAMLKKEWASIKEFHFNRIYNS